MPRVRGNRPAPSFPWAELKHVTGRIGRYFKYHTIGRAQRFLGKLPIISWPFNGARVLTRALARARNRRNRRARREAREAANNNNNNNDNRETLPSPPRTPSPARHSENGGTAPRSSPYGSPSAQLLFEQAQRPPPAAAPPPPPRAPRRNMRLLAEVDEDNVVHGRRVRRQTARYQ